MCPTQEPSDRQSKEGGASLWFEAPSIELISLLLLLSPFLGVSKLLPSFLPPVLAPFPAPFLAVFHVGFPIPFPNPLFAPLLAPLFVPLLTPFLVPVLVSASDVTFPQPELQSLCRDVERGRERPGPYIQAGDTADPGLTSRSPVVILSAFVRVGFAQDGIPSLSGPRETP